MRRRASRGRSALGADSLTRPALPAEGAELVRAAIGASRRPATLRAYRADWQAFAAWCGSKGKDPLPAPAELVAWYLVELATAGRAYSTIKRALASLAVVYTQAGHASPRPAPVVRDTMRGIAKSIKVAPRRAKAAITVPELRRMIVALENGQSVMAAIRDRAILAFGFAGGFRRSEISALDLADVKETEQGLEATIRTSKTDPEGTGRLVGVPYGSDRFTCPVRAVQTWLRARGPREGALFVQITRGGQQADRMSPRAVGESVKRACARAGLDPARYGGHSLRAGLCTAAAQAGKSAASIMAQTGHRSAAMVMRYVRAAGLWDDNAASGIGL